MGEITGWLAPAATMVAALMTAANLGTRVTGWGFVIFTIGAAGWCIEAWLTHQPNLLWSNGFLALVDIVGVYRWLGRRAVLEDGAHHAELRSKGGGRPLFALHMLEGQTVEDPDGITVGRVVGAMADCRSGRISYFVVARGSIVERDQLRAIPWQDLTLGDQLRTTMREGELAAAQAVPPDEWPAKVSPSYGIGSARAREGHA